MLTNTDCTLYNFNGIGYDRHYISAVMWVENRALKVGKQGLLPTDGIQVYIPPKNAPQVKYEATRDMLVKGRCNFVFDNTSQQTVSESMKQFRVEYPDFVVITAIEDKQYSVTSVINHIKLTAR